MHRLGEKAIERQDEPIAARFLGELLPRPAHEHAEAGPGADEPIAFELGIDATRWCWD